MTKVRGFSGGSRKSISGIRLQKNEILKKKLEDIRKIVEGV